MCLRKPRARREEDKQQRQQDILAAAMRLFDMRDYDAIRMDDIAKEAGLAKGTLYLYFATKEDVFLDLQGREIRAWMQQAAAALQAYPLPRIPVQDFARAYVASLQASPRLLRLLAILHAVLERNAAPERIAPFKRALAADFQRHGPALAARLGLAAADGPRLLLRLYALLIGMWQLAEPAPAVRRVLEADAALAVFRIDFATELTLAVTALLEGLSVLAADTQRS